MISNYRCGVIIFIYDKVINYFKKSSSLCYIPKFLDFFSLNNYLIEKTLNLNRYNIMHIYLQLFAIFLSMIIFNLQPVFGQKIKANVSIKLEKLYQEKRMELQDFDRNIQQYIESNRWSDGKIPFEINLNIEMVIDRIQPSFEDVYSARLFISSATTRFYKVDKEWRFPYRINQMLLFEPNIFEGLTGLIDYYIYIIIGEYLDGKEKFGGELYFNRAYEIAKLGQMDRYNRWWEKRADFIRRYLTESHKPFREMTSTLNAALFWHKEKDDKEKKAAADTTMVLLEKVVKEPFEGDFIKDFFAREHQNLAVIFASDTTQYKLLIELDPEHKEFYSNYIKNN